MLAMHPDHAHVHLAHPRHRASEPYAGLPPEVWLSAHFDDMTKRPPDLIWRALFV